MHRTPLKYIIRLTILVFIILLPTFGQSQSRDSDVRSLNREIDRLADMLTKLKAEQAKARTFDVELETPTQDYSKRDSLRLRAVKRKQADSRARIDALTLQVLKISKQLEDPGKRYALAQRMKRNEQAQNSIPNEIGVEDTSNVPMVVSSRAIDLSAVKLVRQGKTLDQARLLIIDQLTQHQVLDFYRGLEKQARFELYDIADEIAASENMDLTESRRSAIYFYLFTK